MGAWNKRPDLCQQGRWERMVFVLAVNLSTTLVASPRIFFPKSTSDGAGFLKGGGDLPGLGFPQWANFEAKAHHHCWIQQGL